MPLSKCVIWSTLTVLNSWTKAKNLCIFHLLSKRQDSLSPQKYAHHMTTSLDLLYNEVKCHYPLVAKLVTLKPSAHTLHALRLAGSQGDCQHPEDHGNWGSAADQGRQCFVQPITKVIPSAFRRCHTSSIYYLHTDGLIRNNLQHLNPESVAKVLSWVSYDYTRFFVIFGGFKYLYHILSSVISAPALYYQMTTPWNWVKWNGSIEICRSADWDKWECDVWPI